MHCTWLHLLCRSDAQPERTNKHPYLFILQYLTETNSSSRVSRNLSSRLLSCVIWPKTDVKSHKELMKYSTIPGAAIGRRPKKLRRWPSPPNLATPERSRCECELCGRTGNLPNCSAPSSPAQPQVAANTRVGRTIHKTRQEEKIEIYSSAGW